MKTSKIIPFMILCALLVGGAAHTDAQRRRPPSSMSHSEKEARDYVKVTPVKCTYISNGHTFSGNVYVVGNGARMKIGTSSITFKNGTYSLSFESDRFKSRDAGSRYNIWTYEKMLNDFTQSGRYETFTQAHKIYLRIYDDSTYSDIELTDKNATKFVLAEDELCFEYSIK